MRGWEDTSQRQTHAHVPVAIDPAGSPAEDDDVVVEVLGELLALEVLFVAVVVWCGGWVEWMHGL